MVASCLRSFLLLIGFEMSAQAVDDDVLVSLVQFFLQLFQGEVNNVVMMYLLGRDGITETQPQSMQKIHFVSR